MRKIFQGFLQVSVSASLLLGLGACTNKGDSKDPVIKLSMLADAQGFDPAFCESLYTAQAIGQVYEGLVEYAYLKRPHQLKANLAEAMPEVSKDGLTYTFKVKKGIRFSDHAAFTDGKGREVKAKDFEYSIKRIMDPKLNSTGFWVYDGHIVGLDKWREEQKKLAATNYELPLEGVQALDDYTLQIKLTRKYPQLLFVLAMPQGYVVPREVVEKTGKDFTNSPVGTGPYRLVSWVRNNKLTYVKNENYRTDDLYPSEGEEGDEAKGLLADKGKSLPLQDKLEIHVYTEEQPRWLNFASGNTDSVRMPKDYYKVAIDPNTRDLSKEYMDKGFQLHKTAEPEVTYIAFNMEDPVIKKQGVNLRRAVGMAIDWEKDWTVFYNKSAVMAQTPVPPGLAGYDANLVNPWKKLNVEKAKELMKGLGFGPNKRLTLTYDTTQGTDGRQMGEKYQKELAEIFIDLKVSLNQFSELQQKQNEKKIQLMGIAWIADYPDVENFLQLLYGPNKSPLPNGSNFDNPKYNALFDQVRGMADSPERRAKISEMQKIFIDELPWIPGVHRISHYVVSKRLKNYKIGYMGVLEPAKYMRLDLGDAKK